MTTSKTFPSFDDAALPMPKARCASAHQDDWLGEMEHLILLLEAIYPRVTPARRLAVEFAHMTDPDELALELYSSSHLIDLNCPEIQRLIESTKGSVQGEFLAEQLKPNKSVGKLKAKRRKRPLKGKPIMFPNLISFHNELARIQAARET